jgi:hypothetical protein
LTLPFNPFTGDYDHPPDGRPYGIDALNQILGDLGDYGKIKAIIGQQSAVDCWANYLCGVERCEYGTDGTWGPVSLGKDWLSYYRTLFEETPFYWATGMQSQITFNFHINGAICQVHQFKGDQKQRRWCSKTSQEDAAFNVNWLLSSDELADVRALSFIMIKDKFLKVMPHAPIFIKNDVDWRQFSIPGQITPRCPVDLKEARAIEAMKGTGSQLYGMWMDYTSAMLNYLKIFQQENENLIICSDNKTKDMVKQQYHESGVVLTHQKILDIASYLADKDNWQFEGSEQYGPSEIFTVTRPPDWVKLTYDSENEFYTLAEAWWILLYAMFMIATHDGLTTIPDLFLRPVIGPCEPSICPKTYGNGLPAEDTPFSINVWWQHDEYEGDAITFAELKNLARGLFPNAKTNQPVGPFYLSDRRVNLPKVLWCTHLNNDSGDPVVANAAELLYILAKMLDNWRLNSTSPDDVQFMPSHVLPKLYPVLCKNAASPLLNLFQTDLYGQAAWLVIGQRWTVKPAVLKPEYR